MAGAPGKWRKNPTTKEVPSHRIAVQEVIRGLVRDTVAEALRSIMDFPREAFIRERGQKCGCRARQIEIRYGKVGIHMGRHKEGAYYPAGWHSTP